MVLRGRGVLLEVGLVGRGRLMPARLPAAAVQREFDRFSSAASFAGWSASCRWKPFEDAEALPVSRPRTELLRFDWELYGLIDPFEIPGPLD